MNYNYDELSSNFTLSSCVSKMGTNQCIQAPPGINYIFSKEKTKPILSLWTGIKLLLVPSPPVHLMHMKQGSAAIYGHAPVCQIQQFAAVIFHKQ